MSSAPEQLALKQDILAIIERADFQLDDTAFNELAARVFRFQFEFNAPYRRYCERRAVDPGTVRDWRQIPAVPTAAFKAAALVAGDSRNAQALFRTSGTTQGREKRGQHYLLDLELYEHSLLRTFAEFVLSDGTRPPMVSLVPQWQPGGESSLAYMIATVMRELGTADSWCAVDAEGITFEKLYHWLQFSITTNRPVCMVGTSLAFAHWFDQMRARKLSLQLPAGSRVMDTGGFKGARRTISSAELRAQYAELLAVPPEFVINEYGMTEMLSQYYDAHLRHPELHSIKQGPPWVRWAVVDPNSLEPLTEAETGLLRHFDLANLFSVSAIQTEDIGRATKDGFELLGRVAGASPRGCSIAMDIFLSTARA